jgi:hypothetical protein
LVEFDKYYSTGAVCGDGAEVCDIAWGREHGVKSRVLGTMDEGARDEGNREHRTPNTGCRIPNA